VWAWMQPFVLIPAQPRRLLAPIACAIPDATVIAIAENTESTRACAKRYRVAQSTVVRIRNGELRAVVSKPANWIRLSDDTVEEIRVRHEESGWSYTQLADFYGIPKATVQALCKYRRR
jgi:hypothetical protein